MKVMTRLQNITYLHTLLEEALSGNPVITGLSQPPVIPGIFKMMCVSGTPGFVPPVANFDGESPDVPSPGPAAPGNKAKKGDIAEVNVFDVRRLLQVAWFAVLFFRKRGEEEKGPWSELFRKQLSAGGRNQWRQNPAGKCGALIVVWLSVTSHLRFCCCYRSNRRRRKRKRTDRGRVLDPTELFSESWTWKSSGCCSTVCCPAHSSTQSNTPT